MEISHKKYVSWKSEYLRLKGWNMVYIVCILFVTAMLFWTLKGNHTLQMRVNTLTQEAR